MRALVLAVLVSPVTAFFLSPLLPRSHTTALSKRPSLAPIPPQTSTPLAAAPSNTESSSKLSITGNNIQVTPAMQDYVEKKLGKVFGKHILENSIRKVDVHLSVVYQPRGEKHDHTAEATIYLKGGQVLRASEETDYMYGSIDLLSHRVSKLLRKFKDRRVSARKEAGGADDFPLPTAEELGEGMWPTEDVKFSGDFNDPTASVDLRLVKKKQFDMPPMSTEDAIVCLDYIGHDFYVFRNKDTKEINVVYKRKQGGVGLIEPQA